MKHDAVLREGLGGLFPWHCRRCYAALTDDERKGDCMEDQMTVWDCIDEA